MNKKRQIISLILCVAILIAMASACSFIPQNQSESSDSTSSTTDNQTGNNIMNLTGFPIVNEPITLTAMVSMSPVQPDWSEILAWQEYEKMTGVKIDFNCIPSSDIAEKRNLALASDELPDLFLRANIPENDIAKYGKEGTFIELSKLIEEYAPNYVALTEKYSDIKKGIPTPEGYIYAFPSFIEAPVLQIHRKTFINQKWLEAVGMKSPQTTEELYQVLKAFKETDCNKNGQNDEIPWGGDKLQDMITVLRGSFGIGNKGTDNYNFDLDPVTGSLRFIPTSPQYKLLLEYLNRLYSEKLIDPEIFTSDGKKTLAKNEQQLLGMFAFSNSPARASSTEKDFAGLEVALKGPNGDQYYGSATSHIAFKGAYVITKANKHPEISTRWVDYLYSEEGTKLLYFGIEGVSYHEVANGVYEYLPSIRESIPEGSSFDQTISKYVPYAGGYLPTIASGFLYANDELLKPVTIPATEKMVPFLPKEVWAPFTFTAKEAELKAELETDILSFIDQRTAEFVNGLVPLSEFDEYVKQIERMGLDRYMKIYQNALDRYLAD